ncbi:hypothetical protein BDV39DRAFT_179889 [Aspergillus sergii]|uniref:Uncharacterized protein n=1 Tax=Aspergillus sergii TaxID=1034303 RepID=A0A5N6WV65_9EURO|nr:hypothetical protein BDV39DRAFT_179889 [Aspergillus sergii]
MVEGPDRRRISVNVSHGSGFQSTCISKALWIMLVVSYIALVVDEITFGYSRMPALITT